MHQANNSPQIDSDNEIRSFYYFTKGMESIGVVDLMNLIAFGGPIKTKLYQYMQDHINKVVENPDLKHKNLLEFMNEME